MPDHDRPNDGTTPSALNPSAPVLVALVLVSLALRPQLAVIGPLAGQIGAELGVSHAFVGLLTAIPVLCMGVFAPLGPSFARALGLRRGIAVAAAAVALAGLLRGVLHGEAVLLALTFAVGIATAVSGPILAMFVRGRLPGHAVAGTAAYAGGTTTGAAMAAAVAVPLAAVLGGWRGSLVAVSIASVLGVVAWLRLTARRRPVAPLDAPAVGPSDPPPVTGWLGLVHLPVGRPVVWAIGLLFGLQSWLYYGITAWLPSVYVEHGWDPAAAATLLSVASITTLGAIVLAPVASRRGVDRRQLLLAAAGLSTLALAGVAAVPGPGWLWAAVLGAGLGLMYTVVLTLPTDIARDARETGGASALMLLVGYLVASGAPFALGAARDASGSFATGMWLLVAIAAAMLPLSWALAPHRLRPARHAVPRA
jgi:CP family cyanate transporter-like MFS transporter